MKRLFSDPSAVPPATLEILDEAEEYLKKLVQEYVFAEIKAQLALKRAARNRWKQDVECE